MQITPSGISSLLKTYLKLIIWHGAEFQKREKAFRTCAWSGYNVNLYPTPFTVVIQSIPSFCLTLRI